MLYLGCTLFYRARHIMIKLSKVKNTILFYSTKHSAPLGYYVIQFRKRQNFTKLSVLRSCFNRAKDLENRLELTANYAEICFKAKQNAYSNRYDLDRDLDTVIHPIDETNLFCTIGQAIDLCLNGLGTSTITGKKIKVITCKEKRIKTIKKLIDSLA